MAFPLSPQSRTEGGTLGGGGLSQQHSLDCGVPEGDILSSITSMHPLAQLAWGYKLGCHQYAAQLYLLMEDHLDCDPDILDRVLQAVARWLQQNWLKLNLMKTEVLYLNCGGLSSEFQLLALNKVPLVLVLSMRSLGVILDIFRSLFLLSQPPTISGRSGNSFPSHSLGLGYSDSHSGYFQTR